MIRPHVFILRGLSGAGKSTLARQIKARIGRQISIVSADDFFTQDGQYYFDAKQLDQAHGQCWERYLQLLANDYSVIVDNTNSQMWHYHKYYALAIANGLMVSVLEVYCPDMATLHDFHARSRHNVPLHVMKKMYYDWEVDSRATIIINPFAFIKKMTA